MIEEYLRRKPNDPTHLMGVVDRGLGNYAEAEPFLHRAVAMNPNY